MWEGRPIRRIIYIISLLLLAAMPSFAEKIPIKIMPMRAISTHHDDVQVGDWIPFTTVNDVYVNGKLYIKKDTPVSGVVDFVHPNGWAGDSAEIWFETFYVTNLENKSCKVDSPLKILGNNPTHNVFKEVFSLYILRIFRGAEIYIEPDTKTYNIFIEQ